MHTGSASMANVVLPEGDTGIPDLRVARWFELLRTTVVPIWAIRRSFCAFGVIGSSGMPVLQIAKFLAWIAMTFMTN